MFDSKNLIYIFTILEAIEKIFIYSKNCEDYEDLYYINEQMNFNAIVNLLIAIGEENKKIDSQIKNSFDFDWKSISKMRDKISHNYRGINPYIVWDIIENHLPNYKTILLDILPKVQEFEEALKDVLESEFYKHLEYLQK
jgi:uncharacterized protein with HEPN domain